jgi:hypothetical protein
MACCVCWTVWGHISIQKRAFRHNRNKEKESEKLREWNKTRGNIMKAKWKISFPYLLPFFVLFSILFWLAKAKEKKSLVCVYHRRYSNAALNN